MTSSPSLLRPPALARGDTVGIIAPAGPVNGETFQKGIQRLRELALNPVYSERIFERNMYFAGDVRRRLEELHGMFERSDVRAIICARGGYGANYLLPHLDLDLIAADAKIFCGYSDLTNLLTYIQERTGLCVFHGPMLSKDFGSVDGVDLASWAAATSGAESWSISSAEHPELRPVRAGSAEGRLFGGCLSLLVASLGTPYEIRTEDTLLFIEDLGEWPYRVDRMLKHLKLAGKFAEVKGIIFGEMLNCNPPANSDYTLRDTIMNVLGDCNVPIAFGLRSGHVSTGNITLPFGVRARLEVSQNVVLRILESAVTPAAQGNRAGQD